MQETSEGPRCADPVLKDWISREELAVELGVSVEALRRWAQRRTGPAFTKLGRRVLYRRAGVNEWLQSREVKTGGGRGR